MTKDNTAEGKPKNLAEFIRLTFGDLNQDSNYYQALGVKLCAGHLLKVAKEWIDFASHDELSEAENLYSFLTTYCAPVEDLKKD